jgi:hypothetical protein
MTAPETPVRPVSLDDLARLRQQTEAASELLRSRLAGHLETIRPILGPERLLGRHVVSPREHDARNADAAFEAVNEEVASLRGKPFALPRDNGGDKITLDARIQLHPFETLAKIGGDKEVVLTNPTCWVATYQSGYSLGQLRKAVANREPIRGEDLLEFVLSAITLRRNLDAQKGVATLLRDLRWEVDTRACDGLGDLQFLVFSAPFSCFRPPDDTIATATRLSGVSAFIELLDTQAVAAIEDPLRVEVEKLLS